MSPAEWLSSQVPPPPPTSVPYATAYKSIVNLITSSHLARYDRNIKPGIPKTHPGFDLIQTPRPAKKKTIKGALYKKRLADTGSTKLCSRRIPCTHLSQKNSLHPSAASAATSHREALTKLLRHHVRVWLVSPYERPALLGVVVVLLGVRVSPARVLARLELDEALGILEVAVDALDCRLDAPLLVMQSV